MSDMSNEKEKAYQAWWSDPASPNNTKDIFNAGWEAHAAAMANSRTAEREEIELAARKIERAAVKRWLQQVASVSFLSGDDEQAIIYRDMAKIYFS